MLCRGTQLQLKCYQKKTKYALNENGCVKSQTSITAHASVSVRLQNPTSIMLSSNIKNIISKNRMISLYLL